MVLIFPCQHTGTSTRQLSILFKNTLDLLEPQAFPGQGQVNLSEAENLISRKVYQAREEVPIAATTLEKKMQHFSVSE